MRTVLLFAVLARTLAGQTPLALLTEFEHPSSDRTVTVMREELSRIMAPLGWRLEWHTLAHAPTVLPRYMIVSFKGACGMQTGFLEETESLTLASTETRGTRILPFSTVECDTIRHLLPALYRTREADAMLGRAIGRLIAHELYHFLLQTRGHSKQGIATAVQTRKELTAADSRFDELSSAMLLLVSSGEERTRLEHQAKTELQRTSAKTLSVQGAGVLAEVGRVDVRDRITEMGRVGQVIPFRPEFQFGLLRNHE